MKKYLCVAIVSILLSGCFFDTKEKMGNIDIASSEKKLSPHIKSIEAKLYTLNVVPENYATKYRHAHLTRLAQASAYFDTEVVKLESIHAKDIVKLDRKILDAQKKLKDLGGTNKDAKLALSQLKLKKSEAESVLRKSVKLIKSRKEDRIKTLNEAYADILLADFGAKIGQK